MLKELYIVRHGHPQTGTGLPYDRVPGPMLSDVGRAEAHITAEYLTGHGIEHVYSSPLDRALGTAQILAATLAVPLQIEPQLAEHRSDEKYDDVKARIRECLARMDAAPYICVALVSHGSPIKAILQVLSLEMIDLTKFVYPNGNHVPTAGVWHAARDMFGAWSLSLVFKPVVETPAAHIPI